MIKKVAETKNSFGYVSMMSISDGEGNIHEEHAEEIEIISLNGVEGTIENITNGSYNAYRPFNVF